MKSFNDCMGEWVSILLIIIMLILLGGFILCFGIAVYESNGLILLLPLLIVGPPTLSYVWNNYVRKSK